MVSVALVARVARSDTITRVAHLITDVSIRCFVPDRRSPYGKLSGATWNFSCFSRIDSVAAVHAMYVRGGSFGRTR